MANAVAVSNSPFSFASQAQHWGGEAWAIEVAIDPQYRVDAAPWIAFFGQLRGKFGTFYFGDTLMGTPQGGVGGTPRVNGANQTGYTVITDGWTSSRLVLKAGDFFQIDNSLYQVTVDATTNGSGQVTIDCWPSLRGHADNASIITNHPLGVFRLTESVIRAIEAPSTQLYSISFTAEEAL